MFGLIIVQQSNDKIVHVTAKITKQMDIRDRGIQQRQNIVMDSVDRNIHRLIEIGNDIKQQGKQYIGIIISVKNP